jgi:Uma2 family endonuclease
MIATFREPLPYLLVHGISWNGYETMLRELEGRRLRITYDQGAMEIMAVSLEHEFDGEILGGFVRLLTLELDIPLRSGGSTTFKDEALEKGIEPNKCWWVQNERKMRGKRRFEINVDPPPDLSIEVEVTRSALNRMGIYAALGIPEVWRSDGQRVRVNVLTASGKYRERSESKAFPFLPMKRIQEFLKRAANEEETALMRSFAKWVREEVAPVYNKKDGKRSRG